MRTLLLLFSLAFAACSNAQTVDQSSALADQLIKALFEKSKVAGISVSINKDDALVYSNAFGYANVKDNIELTPQTSLRAASVSKMITITALAKLHTEGKLEWDLPINKYLKNLKAPYGELTCRQIASHTAGIPHRPAKNNARKRTYTSAQERRLLVEETKPLFEASTQYKYSSLSYNLLESIIEAVSGKTYLEYLNQDIFEPLGMKQTTPDSKENKGNLYFLEKGKLKIDRHYSNGSYKLAGAGFRSTTEDLVKMLSAYSNGFLNQKTVEELFDPMVLNSGEVLKLGIGWRINTDFKGRKVVQHAGNWQGARTVVVHFPEEQLNVAIMINTKCVMFIEETAHLIADLFLSPQEKNILAVDTEVKIIFQNESNNTAQGKLIISKNDHGNLTMDTDIKFLQNNRILKLHSQNDYSLITEFGALYLELQTDPVFEGKLYLYQALQGSRKIFSTIETN